MTVYRFQHNTMETQLDDTPVADEAAAAAAAAAECDPWDALCVHPHAGAVAEGRTQGAADGRAAGWRQGYAAGRTTAIEYGTELGFVRGVVEALRGQCAAFSMSSAATDDGAGVALEDDDRLRNSIRNLLAALDDFPSPEAVFRNMDRNNKSIPRDPLREEDPNSSSDPEEVNADTEETNSDDRRSDSRSDEPDVAAKMQRVRARFKLLMVQLGLPYFSLKSIMDQQRHQQFTTETSRTTTAPVRGLNDDGEPSNTTATVAAAVNQGIPEW